MGLLPKKFFHSFDHILIRRQNLFSQRLKFLTGHRVYFQPFLFSFVQELRISEGLSKSLAQQLDSIGWNTWTRDNGTAEVSGRQHRVAKPRVDSGVLYSSISSFTVDTSVSRLHKKAPERED